MTLDGRFSFYLRLISHFKKEWAMSWKISTKVAWFWKIIVPLKNIFFGWNSNYEFLHSVAWFKCWQKSKRSIYFRSMNVALYQVHSTYSDLPNNHAANLIIFLEKKTHLHNLKYLCSMYISGPTRLLIFDIFPSKPDFHLNKWEKILPTQPY